MKRYKIGGEETERPPGVIPHFWNRFNAEDKAECLAEWEQHKKNMTYDPKTGEYTIPPAVQAPGASVPNPRTQAPTTIVCFGNEHQLNLAAEQERLGGIFERRNAWPAGSLISPDGQGKPRAALLTGYKPKAHTGRKQGKAERSARGAAPPVLHGRHLFRHPAGEWPLSAYPLHRLTLNRPWPHAQPS